MRHWREGAIVCLRGLYCDNTQQKVMDFTHRYSDRFEKALIYEGGEGAPKHDESHFKLGCIRVSARPEYKEIDQVFFGMVNSAVREYMRVLSDLTIFVKNDQGYTLNRYREGDYMKIHTDENGGVHRRITYLYYANDDYEGGEIRFPAQNLTVRPKRGDALLFPSCYAYPHESLPILKGTKYCMVTWLL